MLRQSVLLQRSVCRSTRTLSTKTKTKTIEEELSEDLKNLKPRGVAKRDQTFEDNLEQAKRHKPYQALFYDDHADFGVTFCHLQQLLLLFFFSFPLKLEQR